MSTIDLEEARVLDARLTAIRRDHRRAEHQLAVLLVEMDERRYYRSLGYASLEQYASQALDLPPRQTRELRRIGRALPELPTLAAALAAGELDWTKAREIVRVATAATEEAWVARARVIGSRALEQEVTNASPGGAPAPEDAPPPLQPPRRSRHFLLEAADEERLQQALLHIRATTGVSRDTVGDGALLAAIAAFYLDRLGEEPRDAGASSTAKTGTASDASPPPADPELPADPEPPAEPYRVVLVRCPDCHQVRGLDAEVSDTVAREACCDSEVIDMREGPKRGHSTRAIPPAMRRIVFHRDGWRCSVPGCTNRAWLQVHHDRHWARGGGHEEGNLRVICSTHHRGIHEGLIALTRLPSGATQVEYGDGRKLRGPVPMTHVGHRARPVGG